MQYAYLGVSLSQNTPSAIRSAVITAVTTPPVWNAIVAPDDGILEGLDEAAPPAVVGELNGVEAVVAVTPPELVVDDDAPFDVSTSRCCGAHAPTREVRADESANAAGVEPQFVYCCMYTMWFSRSKTAMI